MNLKVFIGACVLSGLVACSSVKQDEAGLSRPGVGPVSYTHLTLPTILLV